MESTSKMTVNSRRQQKSGYRGKTNHYLSGIEKLCELYNKCIAVYSDYVEK